MDAPTNLSCKLRNIIDKPYYFYLIQLFYALLLILIFNKKLHWSFVILYILLATCLSMYAFSCSSSATAFIRVIESLWFGFICITVIITVFYKLF